MSSTAFKKQELPEIPHLRKTKRSSQLYVGGKPFLMLAGELHNSTFSNAAYMAGVWPAIKAMSLNTLLGAVTWEMTEPVEGKFQFEELDKCILDARKHGIHLVLLWFGAYKNTLGTYAPHWVKQDVKRFPRLHIQEADGKLITIDASQPYRRGLWQADARAFAALMHHLREFDMDYSTVIMVQVENEMGVLGDSRDRSRIADELYNSAVPEGLFQHLQHNFRNLHPDFRSKFPEFPRAAQGPLSWSQAFGTGPYTEDLFMADAFSRYVQQVAAAGKAEYNIPLYVNAALCSEAISFNDDLALPFPVADGNGPGSYPSGGPVGHNLDIYRFNAPDVDFCSPDIYFQDYEEVCECYRYQDQPLFIPEQRRDEYGARRIWLALGTYLALGCSPFGIDTLCSETSPFTKHYKLLHPVRHYILDAQANRPDDIMGFFFDEKEAAQEDKTWIKSFGQFRVEIQRAFVFGKPGAAAGMIIRQSDGSFLAIGYGFQVKFQSENPQSTFTGLLWVEEKEADEQGNLHTRRIFNGDETQFGKAVLLPSEHPDDGHFPIPVHIPARTMIVQCKPYSLQESSEDF